MSDGLEFQRLGPGCEGPLAAFFRVLVDSGDEPNFHPHPLTAEHAATLIRYHGRDLYYVARDGDTVLGYAMLRGWDEGFAIPSLGIALAPEARGTGLAAALMTFLHAAARRRGAKRVRLTVEVGNKPAIERYLKVGYRFEPQVPGSGRLVGFFDL